jgi:integrase
MGHVRKVNGKYRAYVHRNGRQLSKRFTFREDADRWTKEQERSIETTGLPLTIDALRKHTLGSLVERYLKEKTPDKGSAASETTVLKKFLKHPVCKQHLPISQMDAYAYIHQRLKDKYKGKKLVDKEGKTIGYEMKPVTPRTVWREKNIIQHIFEVAKKEWDGFTNLPNPFAGIQIKGSQYRREMRLNPGDLEKLISACDACRTQENRHFIKLAIYLAVDTGMRLDEMFSLTWADVDIPNRTIKIRHSKTDYKTEKKGREIVMPFHALTILWNELSYGRLTIPDKARFLTDHPAWLGFYSFPEIHPNSEIQYKIYQGFYKAKAASIFPMSKVAFKQSWQGVVARSGIKGLQFRDLRREAGSRFDDADLTNAQHDYMLGHNNNSIRNIYIRPFLDKIQDKLDRYVLDGKTFKEALKEHLDLEEQIVKEEDDDFIAHGPFNRRELLEFGLRPERVRRILKAQEAGE